MSGQRIQQEAICYQWFKQRLILSISKPSISQWSQIKENTVEPSVPAREFNLKAYAAITWHNDPAIPGLEPRLADHRSQAVPQRYRLRHRGRPIGPLLSYLFIIAKFNNFNCKVFHIVFPLLMCIMLLVIKVVQPHPATTDNWHSWKHATQTHGSLTVLAVVYYYTY